jgi:fructuronate reductase
MTLVARPLTPDELGVTSRPRARIAHIGLGAFHRAHQVWFTAHAEDGDEWGVCSFAGRTSGLAPTLRAQGGLYTLIERSGSADTFEVVTNLVEVHEGTDIAALIDVLSRPEIVVLTTTVTEAGYRLGLDGTPDLADAELVRDLELLRAAVRAERLEACGVATVPGRILLGLEARRRAGAGAIALVPCDNVPSNGRMLERGVTQLAQDVHAALATWMSENVTFVSTSVDRITPHTTDRDVDLVARETGWRDGAPVVTEPFASWVLSGSFPAGRPRWEAAGALVVADIEPYERRKLWLLNGAHSLLAYLGLEAGLRTVAEAIGDAQCRRAVELFWASARHHLADYLDLDAYCAQLVERFANTRIAYQLEQVASDSVMKLRTRIVPVVLAESRAGRDCPAGVAALAAWVRLVVARGSFPDAEFDAVTLCRSSPSPTRELLALVEPDLVEIASLVVRVEQLVDGGATPPGAATAPPPTTRRN